LEGRAASPDFWEGSEKMREEVFAQTRNIKSSLDPYNALVAAVEDLEVYVELAREEDTLEKREKALGEASIELARCQKAFRDLEMKSLLGDKLDPSNCYLTINAGAGGTESCDWADILWRMYRRFAERKGFRVTIMDYLAGEEAGIKSVSALIEGPYAFGMLKAERGVHRLVRISPFDSNKRRHTSFCALDVVAEIDDSIDITINESDLKIDTYRASGSGGQHVNTTDSAVRITHLPSGMVVQCQAERSQHGNRAKAMKMLEAKLYEWELDQKRKEMEKFYAAKGSIAWGSQIRSYVMQPYTMVKDHRTDVESGNVGAVLDGDLDEFIEGYLKMRMVDESA